MNLSTQPYKGTRDFYPEDLQKRNYIFNKWREALVKFGFSEYETSLLENAEIYIAKSGEELGGKQLYNFHDKGDRFVALRPEQTPSLARLVANKFGELRFPLRWFSIPNCFRYEQPQKGRFREHWQLNVDIIGLEAGGVELEIMNILAELFKSFGATQDEFKIMFNHRQVLDDWLLEFGLDLKKSLVYAVLDDWFKLSLEANKLKLSQGNDQIAGLLETEIQAVVDLTQKQGKSWQKYLEIAHNVPEISILLNQLPKIQPNIEFDFNPCIIRGIAYYTGIVFEAFDKNPVNPRALFGGGRYDNLMELFDKQAPAVGFGWGDATMSEFLDNWNLWPESFDTPFKVGILVSDETKLSEVFTKVIPELKQQGKIYDINYEFERSENKRYETLKKRGADEILKI